MGTIVPACRGGSQSSNAAQHHDKPSKKRTTAYAIKRKTIAGRRIPIDNIRYKTTTAVPFLWVLPPSIYLLSFVICFDKERWYRRGLYNVLL